MSEATRHLIECYFQAYNARDIGGLIALLDAAIVHEIDQRRREFGKDAFARFLTHKARHYAEHAFDIEILTNADGSRAAACYVVLGVCLDGGARLANDPGRTYRVTAGTFFDVRGGTITRISNYDYRRMLWGRAA